MNALHYWDWVIVGLVLVVTVALSHIFRSKSNNLASYFQSEGKLPWFVAGTAMVATTFAADTPLAVTELVVKYGVSGNWLWWYMALGSLLTAFVFAPLWKRSGTLTDLEWIPFRYGDNSASTFLRKFRAVYLGFFLNIVILAWVNLAMKKIAEILFPEIPALYLVTGIYLLGFVYTAYSGLSGISYVDSFQFLLSLVACIFLAYYSLVAVGGLDQMHTVLPKNSFSFFPTREGGLEWETLAVLFFVQWWASYYPGAEPGGGGYVAQRILAVSDPKGAKYASLWFSFAHYFLRPWPWILTALASVVLFGVTDSSESGKGFVRMIGDHLPIGLKGLLISMFLSAYLSTIATHLNWGSSYIINDFYKTLVQTKTDAHYLKSSYLVQLVFLVLSLLLAFTVLESVSGAWIFILEASSGIGFVLLLRWLHPRINAWSEIGAFFFPPVFYTIAHFGLDLVYPRSILFTTSSSIVAVLILTYLTPSTPKETLKRFYSQVLPPGVFWQSWLKQNQISAEKPLESLSIGFLQTVLGFLFLVGLLFGLGKLILG